MTEKDALLQEIKDINLSRDKALSRILFALATWAESEGVHGLYLMELREHLEDYPKVSELLEVLDSSSVREAIRIADNLTKELESLEATVEKLEDDRRRLQSELNGYRNDPDTSRW